MTTKKSRSDPGRLIRRVFTIVCATLIVAVGVLKIAQTAQDAQDSPDALNAPALVAPAVAVQETSRIPTDQLDSLVAPIALYPDDLLSQVLVASTYPLEIIQLQQWLERHKDLKDKALAEAVSKKPWDPSIQAMAATPDVVKRLADDIEWTTDLGNAFLSQQSDVMDAVQRMRQKAQGTGALKSNQHQVVETEVIDETKTVIVVRQADPDIVYVPSYSPLYVYGPPVYPYPSIYYPPYAYPYSPGMVAASAISFGVGWAMGAAWGGGWGWHAGWGHNDININHNNYFNRNTNISGIRGGNTWQHNPVHRGGAPYVDHRTADRFGGTARGDSLANRQAGARQQIGRQGGNLPSTRDRPGGISDRSRPGGVSDRSRPGGVSDRSRPGGVSDRSRPGGVSDRSRPGGVSDRSRPGGVSDRSRVGGGGDRVGSRDVGRNLGGGNRSAFGGGSRGYSGGSARASSSRGSSSFGGSRGGGSRSGGSRGGGSRGGGGGRRR